MSAFTSANFERLCPTLSSPLSIENDKKSYFRDTLILAVFLLDVNML